MSLSGSSGNRSKRKGSICLEHILGICLGRYFTDKFDGSVRITGLLTINIEMDDTPCCISFNIDRCIIGVLKLEILHISCNGRVIGRLHIMDHHGMGGPLHNTKLCTDHRIIQRGGYLTDSSAIGHNRGTVLIGGRLGISILRCHGI